MRSCERQPGAMLLAEGGVEEGRGDSQTYHEDTDGDAASEACEDDQTGYERKCDPPIVLERIWLEALAHSGIALRRCSNVLAIGAAFTSRCV